MAFGCTPLTLFSLSSLLPSPPLLLFSYKLGALEIERELLDHPKVVEVAVVGVPDPEYGERVGAGKPQLCKRLTSCSSWSNRVVH